MLQTAPYNLGWQTHFLNLVHTPRKAVSAVIAAEAMRRLPRMKSYGRYPDSQRFGDFVVSYEGDRSELNASDAFMYAGDTADAARDPSALQRLVGFGSSGTVDYEGTGAYFLDKLRDGLWRLELYPDEILVRDPFEQPQPGKVVSRLLYRSWPMKLQLPDLGAAFIATPLNVPGDAAAARTAMQGVIAMEPGVWLLSRKEGDASGSLPAKAGRVALKEFHVNARVSYPDFIQTLAPREFMAGAAAEIRVRVASDSLPEEVRLWVRPAGTGFFGKPIAMRRARGNDYTAALPAEDLEPGLYEYAVSARSGDRTTSFPGGASGQPHEWPFRLDTLWSFSITPPGTTMRLFNPKADYERLSFVRPGEQYRNPFFRLTPGESADEVALTLDLPDLGPDTPARYAAALYIGDAMAVRRGEFVNADALHVKLRADGGSRKLLQVTLVEKDGTAWTAPVLATGAWGSVTVPLRRLVLGRSIHIPSPYPGLWNYWREAAQGRGGPADHIHVENVERLQLTVTPNIGDTAADTARGVSVETITLSFAGSR
jgi:hypothetical protein